MIELGQRYVGRGMGKRDGGGGGESECRDFRKRVYWRGVVKGDEDGRWGEGDVGWEWKKGTVKGAG
jgi:hypothetical protein